MPHRWHIDGIDGGNLWSAIYAIYAIYGRSMAGACMHLKRGFLNAPRVSLSPPASIQETESQTLPLAQCVHFPFEVFMPNDRLSDAQVSRLAENVCLLCSKPACMVGIFVPNAASNRTLHAPPGKVRTVAYSLCRRCSRRRGSVKRVEAVIFSEIQDAARRPEAN